MSMPVKPSILLIDDEENLRRTLALILQREGYQVETAATVKEARQRLETSTYDLTFLDLKLPDANGLTLLPDLNRRFPNMPVLVLTAHDKLDAAVEAVQQGARDYLLKPIDPLVIIRHVESILGEQLQSQPQQGNTSEERRKTKKTQKLA
jgi:DNA-binding NtrC family response regulator